MANIKISQLPAKGANLASADLLEVSEFTGTGYVSKSITGQEIIDAASGGGIKGTNTLLPIQSGQFTSALTVVKFSFSLGKITANQLILRAYIPSNSFTCSNVKFTITTAGPALSQYKFGIYSDNNGAPDSLLFESSDIDISTTGDKIITANFDFVAGTIYWIAECNSDSSGVYRTYFGSYGDHTVLNILPGNSVPRGLYNVAFTYGNLPTTCPTITSQSETIATAFLFEAQ